MTRPKAKNRLTESEVIALSRAIAVRGISDGSYWEIINGAQVRQPVVSLALHRRLVARTPAVDRLFEFLAPELTSLPKVEDAVEQQEGGDPDDRFASILEIVSSLTDGSAAGDVHLVNLLLAVRRVANGSRERSAHPKTN